MVFKLEYGCTGTKWCDSSARVRRGCSCDLRLVFSATIEQVSKGQVHVQFCGPRGLAIEQRIILYLEADPAIDPAQYSRGYQLPQGAMQMVVFATPAMIDAAVDLDEIGVDTKHRTNEDKGCVQAIMWFKQRTQSRWSGDFGTAHTVSSSDDEDTPPSSMQATTNETAILSSLQACGVVPSEVVEDELDQFAQELDHQETSLATRTGRSKAIEAKQRHQWRGGVADTRRPKFGLKNRSRPGGIAAIHRVDASKTGRSSRLASVAQIRGVKRAQSHANTIATATSISAERRGEKRGSRPSAVDTEPAAKEGRTGISF